MQTALEAFSSRVHLLFWEESLIDIKLEVLQQKQRVLATPLQKESGLERQHRQHP